MILIFTSIDSDHLVIEYIQFNKSIGLQTAQLCLIAYITEVNILDEP